MNLCADITPGNTGPGCEKDRLGALVRADYEKYHPDDSFDDLKRRARFSKEDKGLLRDWVAVAEQRARTG
ncbi:hypothetical protein VSX64_21465 [Aurantimonas sp. C2-6-R+9]|uniref:hypothetical protein n=1 Tax=unclassified Aurantimonas TaxID=2638230 RepID=UPI002E18DF2F|nr:MULTISPECIES: hypothetical protein [unclassified Aurantimonas]MEC5293207.1 hypothetical protein [Aurantimonas sp. C2-3-R2]MEC5383368.1 hypothetical protein [Aurantimonas sp. C2-6-R+9]MEC5414301.1 hypothetical protein [Aurantimonas sp. C2-4-R8]